MAESVDLLPDDEPDLTEEEDFALAEAEAASATDLLGFGPGDDPDLVLLDRPRAPVGRSWAYDLIEGRFIGVHSPLTTTGLTTLRYWIAKCLQTERDSLAIHPPGYGVEGRDEVIGSAVSEGVGALLEERVRDALLFHPAITDVTDFTAFLSEDEEDDEAVFLSFTVVTDLGDEFTISGLRAGT